MNEDEENLRGWTQAMEEEERRMKSAKAWEKLWIEGEVFSIEQEKERRSSSGTESSD